ncbi:MAG: S9 family peptidase [Gemmatimonadaceae bacterium]|nr:S9 family peptidase [Gemmatimonadaceae bacterium]
MRLRLIGLTLSSAALATSGTAQTFSLDHFANIARVSDLRLAPASDRAVFVVAWPNYESNAFESEIVEVDLRTRVQRTLTQRKTASSPRWSPDGDRLAFLAAVEGKTQLFVLPTRGGEAVQVTRSPTGVGSFAWRPDGLGFAFTAAPSPASRGRWDDAFEVNGNDYLTLAAPRTVHLWTIAADGGAATRVAEGEWSIPSLFATVSWSADGKKLYFTRQESPGTREWERRELSVVDIATGRITPVPGLEDKRCGAGWPSPDGSRLLVSCPVDGHVKNQSELAVLSLDGGVFTRLTASLDRNFSRGTWRGDSRAVIAAAPDGTASGVWELPLGGAPRRIDVGRVGVNDLDLTADGSLVFIGSEALRPPELYLLRAGASVPERLTNIHATVAALTLGKVEAMTWKSDDGLPLSGILTFPPDFDPSRRYPLLLNIHGGPWGSSREVFAARNQLLAGKGFVVFEPNYRGSDNMGNALYSAVYRDHGAGPGRDVMAGLAILKKRAWVDTTRIGVSGWSYGGYMTTWLIGHYTGWKAAMAGAAVIDLVDDYNLNDLSLYIRAYGETLSFPKDLALMKEQSPMTYVDNMRTPLLLLSNTGDVRVPVTQSYKLYNALKERGREVRMKLWPVAGHFPADPWRARDIDREWAEFFVQRLK